MPQLTTLVYCLFFHLPAAPEIYTLSLHDALPISSASEMATSGDNEGPQHAVGIALVVVERRRRPVERVGAGDEAVQVHGDRKSTRLNSSHTVISYAVFCLKKKSIGDHRLHHGQER